MSITSERKKNGTKEPGWASHSYLPIKSPDGKINTQETVWADGGVGGLGGGKVERKVGRRKEV